MTLRICVSILPRTIPEALRLIKRAENARANFIEVRLENLETPLDLADLTAPGKAPKIAAYRLQHELGKATESESEAWQMLLSAAESGFDYVDIDLSSPRLKEHVDEIKETGALPIVSFHDFSGSPSLRELNSILEKEISSGAEVCKIVTTANQAEDNLTVLNFTSQAQAKTKLVCFAMGELGRVSRLLSPMFGGYFTFASLERGGETAPGQMTIQDMQKVYQLLGLK